MPVTKPRGDDENSPSEVYEERALDALDKEVRPDKAMVFALLSLTSVVREAALMLAETIEEQFLVDDEEEDDED